MGELGLGRLIAHDVRDEAYLMRHAPRQTSTPIGELAPKTWPMRADALDQNGTGTCAAHAGAHFILCAPMEHRLAGFSAFSLYREAVLVDEWADNDAEATNASDDALQFGTSGRAVMKALEARGIIAEYRWGYSVDDVVRWVATRGPVMIGTNWYDAMFNPTAEGFVKIPPADTIAGGHETLVRGVHPQKGVARVVNSWSPRWNHAAVPPRGLRLRGGEFLIDFETLHRLMREDGDAVSGIERKKPK